MSTDVQAAPAGARREAPASLPWRRAMVTGASSGIGEAIAHELAAAGVDLVLVGRNTDALDAVRDRARSAGVRAEVLSLDLADAREVDRAVAWLATTTPMLDLLVNNAGSGRWGSFLDVPVERAIETMRVNCEALVRLTHAAVSRMDEVGHGSVVAISSTAGASPGPSQAVYAASKAFVSSFSQALSSELSATSVRCTTVLPSYTRTRFFEGFGRSVDHVPDELWMSPHEVAVAALDAARTGEETVYVSRSPGGRGGRPRALARRAARRLAVIGHARLRALRAPFLTV